MAYSANSRTTNTNKAELTEKLPDDELTLPIVAGLDHEAGLRRIMGKKKIYLTLLRKFVDGQKHAPENIRSALANGEREIGERLAHTLKGVAGNIGAIEIQAAAAKLEESINKERPDADLESDLAELREKLDCLISQLEPALERQTLASSLTIDSKTLTTACDRLWRLVTESDPQALDVLQENSSLLRAASALEKSIQCFDFDAALAALRQAKDGFEQK